MKDIKLTKPSLLYQSTFLDFVKDVKESGYESYTHYVKAEKNFSEFMNELIDMSEGVNIKKGWAPCSSYWLIDNNEEVIGVIRIRHRVDNDSLEMAGHIGYEIKSSKRKKGYGQRLLELGLMEARKIGLQKVLITCDEDNVASKRMIEKCKSKYKKSIFDEESGKNILQYEVDTVYD
ncbi:GNAT family N-acetyltransferase [Petrocella sp. FN5]|uniref:GNAT family N-acetyltransferase n=1 Tax=Petrocella sp. FN5 TaxID=3032002 RepID=UPI0023D99ACD|nr:GNAT family N-acetyltransferase [Petrocella sp. FN5]MDF1617979.1 GNAT family N-acetyltransferase [Petrocella sp. FN5]